MYVSSVWFADFHMNYCFNYYISHDALNYLNSCGANKCIQIILYPSDKQYLLQNGQNSPDLVSICNINGRQRLEFFYWSSVIFHRSIVNENAMVLHDQGAIPWRLQRYWQSSSCKGHNRSNQILQCETNYDSWLCAVDCSNQFAQYAKKKMCPKLLQQQQS